MDLPSTQVFRRRPGVTTTRRRTSGGFTLIEMIIVIFIIGITAAVVVPNIGLGMSGTRAQIAARGLVQMSRYARNMALANQTEVELSIQSNGVLRVRALAAPAAPAGTETMEDDAFGSAAMAGAAAYGGGGDTGVATGNNLMMGEGGGASAAQSSQEAITLSIDMDQTYEHVSILFDGYTDGAGRLLPAERSKGSRVKSLEEEEREKNTLIFRSNGVCKPCRFRIETGRGDLLYVMLDMFGKGTIDTEAP